MRFCFIEDHRNAYPVRTLCAVLEVSPSGYYAWRNRPESARHVADRGLAGDIRRIHAETRAVYGSPRVHAALRAEGRRVGVNRVARLMRHHGIQGRTTEVGVAVYVLNRVLELGRQISVRIA